MFVILCMGIRTTSNHFTPTRKFWMLDGSYPCGLLAVVIEVPFALLLRYLETEQSAAVLHLDPFEFEENSCREIP